MGLCECMCVEFVWVCMCSVCVFLCICVSMHTYVDQRRTLVIFSTVSVLLSWDSSLIKPETRSSPFLARLAGHQAFLGITVSDLSYWEYRHLWLFSAFTWVLKDWNSSLHACRANTLPMEPSLESPYLIFGWTTSSMQPVLLGNTAQTWSCQDWPVPLDCLCLTRLSLTFMNLMNKQFIGP